MRGPFLAVPLSLAVLSLPSLATAQHVGVAPAFAPPVMHAAPLHVAPMHVAPAGAAHAATVHSARPSSQIRYGSHGPSASKAPSRPVIAGGSTGTNPPSPPNQGWHPVNPQPTLPTYPPLVPGAPVLLPGNIFSGNSCFAPYSCYPVPGFGFDYEHFFAVHPNWGQPILTAGVVVPFFGGGGFYMPIPYYSVPPAPEEEQAPPPAQNETNQNQQQAPPQQYAPAMAQGYSAPSEPVYEYVFVKRDGTKIFAVAYSLTKDKLQYVTKEGLRRTIPLDALDMDATQKSNEERGNTITLPTPPPSAMAAL